MLESISLIAGIIFGGLVMVAAYLTIFENRKRRRIAKYEKQREEEKRVEKLERKVLDETLKEDIMERIDCTLEKRLENYETQDEAKEGREKIWKGIKHLDIKLEEHFNESNQNELGRLAHEIVTYADDLRNGFIKTKQSWQHISVSYDKYKSLGGNHYVDDEYNYIREMINKQGFE